jgi:hypothetical protein
MGWLPDSSFNLWMVWNQCVSTSPSSSLLDATSFSRARRGHPCRSCSARLNRASHLRIVRSVIPHRRLALVCTPPTASREIFSFSSAVVGEVAVCLVGAAAVVLLSTGANVRLQWTIAVAVPAADIGAAFWETDIQYPVWFASMIILVRFS